MDLCPYIWYNEEKGEYPAKKKGRCLMKKMISLLLIVCMACMLIPATAEGVTGLWYMVEMVANDVTINPAQMGINWTMELSEDGTAYNRMEAMGEVQEKSGTWTLDGDTVTVTIEDSPAAFQLVDGKLTIEMDGQTAVFSQEAPEAAVKPGVVAAESEEAFFGDWEIEAVDMMGMYMGKDMFAAAGMEGFTVKLSIEAGKVTMSSKMSASAEEQSQTFDSRFEDGKLIMEIDMGEAAATAEAAGLDISSITDGVSTIELLDNGGLLYGMNLMGMTIGVYMVPAAAAEAPAA